MILNKSFLRFFVYYGYSSELLVKSVRDGKLEGGWFSLERLESFDSKLFWKKEERVKLAIKLMKKICPR